MNKTFLQFMFLLIQINIATADSTFPTISNFESCNSLPSSCADLRVSGTNHSGIYTIYPKPWFDKHNISVYCDMQTDDGGWTVFQRRDNFEVQQSFIQNWNAYRTGFGELDNDFWLGNDNLFILTNQEYVSLRIDIEDFESNKDHVLYNEFRISGGQDRYRLKVDKFVGTIADGMAYHNNKTFVAFDDGDVNKCAEDYKGGWWYGMCHHVNLNGVYEARGFGRHSVVWDVRNSNCLKKTEMKMRPTYFSLPPS